MMTDREEASMQEGTARKESVPRKLSVAGYAFVGLLFLCLVLSAWGSMAADGSQDIEVSLFEITPADRDEAPEQARFSLEPLCFEGEANYQYFGNRLAVQIQRQTTGDIAYFICDVQTTDPAALRSALSNDKVYGAFEFSSVIASRHEAVLAINGDDYGYRDSKKYGIIIRNGELIRAKATSRHMLVLEANGDLRVIADRGKAKPNALADRLMKDGAQQTWEFGPELIRDGQAVSLNTKFNLISTRSSQLEPRTAIGQVGPLHYVVLVVDGRQPGYSNGVSLSGLQQLLLETGAQTAFNLDGGGSTTLVFHGEVINKPSAGKERSVSDILYFK